MSGRLQRIFFLVSLMTIATLTSAQTARPPSGISVDETRLVAQLPAQSVPCISIALEGVVIQLAKTDLEQLIAARPAKWTTEPERQAIIAAGRAKGLLAKISENPGLDGCAHYKGVLDADSQWAVLDQLEKGHATVIDGKSGKAVRAINVHYWGDRSGHMLGRGEIHVSLPDTGRQFLNISWWMS
jgi:hypothetical protein